MKSLWYEIRLWWMSKLLLWMQGALPDNHPNWIYLTRNMLGIAELLNEDLKK